MILNIKRVFFILLFVSAIIGSAIFISRVFSYDTNNAHPYLTEKAVELFTQNSEIEISQQQLEWLKQGAIEEDTIPRWMNHFYNPITGKGLGVFASSKVWAQSPNLQKSYFLFKGDQTWQKAINSYTKGNKKDAFIALGHILHLLEDATVPAHTRLDAHPEGDPYESWVKNNAKKNFEGVSITNFDNLDNFFDLLANYSNKYFLSKDSIQIDEDKFQEKVINKKVYLITQDDQNNSFKLVEKKIVSGEVFYNIDNDFIHSDYYSLLAPKAISYGAGVIDLFFKEVGIEEQKQQEKSWFDKLIGSIAGVFGESSQIAAPVIVTEDQTPSPSPTPTPALTPTPSPAFIPSPTPSEIIKHSVSNNFTPTPTPSPVKPLMSNMFSLPYPGFGGGGGGGSAQNLNTENQESEPSPTPTPNPNPNPTPNPNPNPRTNPRTNP